MSDTKRVAKRAGQPKKGTPAAKKPDRPVPDGAEEVTLLQDRPPGSCGCIAGEFQRRPWGLPVVKAARSQGYTIITILVPIRFQFTCANASGKGRCVAILAGQIVKTDFGIKDVLIAEPGQSQSHTAPCNGRATSSKGATLSFLVVLDGEHKEFVGTVDLRFSVEQCPQVPPWDMTLVIRDGDLDEGESDYDGDGRRNSAERRGLEWNPER